MQLILFFAFFFLWLAFFGGTVGSFLNVVVYRVPAGMSVVHPPSRCPNCGHDIRWYDNIPVLGWLWLGGRCRDCREPIARRYPIVEALTAAVFLGIAAVDGLHTVWHESFLAVLGRFDPAVFWGTCAEYLIHMTLLCTVWAAALMQFDRQRMPSRAMIGMALVLGGAMALAFHFEVPIAPRTAPAAAAMVPLSGLFAAGYAMVFTYFWTWIDDERIANRWTFVELAGLCGLVFPPLSMITALAWAVVFGLLAVLVHRRANYPLLCLLAGVIVELTAGPYYQQLLPRPGQWWYWLMLSVLLMLMTEACMTIRRREGRCPLSN